jgi:4-hydroxy-2-oxoheptanedioate aldolase
MDGKELVDALHGGRRIYGTLVVSPSPKWIEGIAGLDLDCVFIDTEHSPMDWRELGWMCRAYAGLGMAPIVRIPSADPFEACRVLDMGASAIVAAYIETAEEVRVLSGAVKRRPLKGKRLRDALSGKANLEEKLETYLRRKNEKNALLVNIESAPAVQALDEILAVPGLDGVLIGPHDLSCSLGIPEEYDHPLMDKTIREIIAKARAKSIGVGIHNWPFVEQVVQWTRGGLNLILHASDLTLFLKTLHRDLNRLREGAGDKAPRERLDHRAI